MKMWNLFIVLVVAGLGLGQKAEAVRHLPFGGSLRLSVEQSWQRVDPLEAVEPEASLLTTLTYNGLFQLSPKGEPKPWLASKIESSDGGKVYTLTLRPGVQFSDGRPFGPKDVIYSLNRAAQHPVAGPLLKAVEGYPGELDITQTDENVLRFKLRRAEAAFTSILSTPQLFMVADGFSAKSKGTQGTGPFVLDKEGRGVLLANANHPEGRPYLDRIELKVQPLVQDRLLDYKRELVDVLLLEPGDQAGLAGRWLVSNTPQVYYLDFTCSMGERDRRLVEGAAKKETMLRGLFRGRGRVLGDLTDIFKAEDAAPSPVTLPRASLLAAALDDKPLKLAYSRGCGETCERIMRGLSASLSRQGARVSVGEPRKAQLVVRRFSPGGQKGQTVLRMMERELRRCAELGKDSPSGGLDTGTKSWLLSAPLFAGVPRWVEDAFMTAYGVPDLSFAWVNR